MANRRRKGSDKRDRVREAAKKRVEEVESGGGSMTLDLPDDVEFFQPNPDKKDKTIRIDILPYIVTVKDHAHVQPGETWYSRPITVCFGVGPEGKTLLSPKTAGKPCPIMEEWKILVRSPDEEDGKAAKDIKPKDRELFNVIDLDDQEKGVQLWEISTFNFGNVLNEVLDNAEDEDLDFYELVGGRTLVVKMRKRKLGRNKFLEAVNVEFEDRDDYNDDILDDTLDLDAILKIPTYDELKDIFEGKDEDTSGDDDNGGEETRSRRSSRRSRDDDDPDNDDSGDDEGDPEPRRSRRSRSDNDDGDDGGENDDTEDPDQCPACKGSGESTRGKQCRPCKGTGVLKDDDLQPQGDDPAADDGGDDDDPPPRSRRTRSSSQSGSSRRSRRTR